eukprot:10027839-Lingulodinium_polyedra.AAC.1
MIYVTVEQSPMEHLRFARAGNLLEVVSSMLKSKGGAASVDWKSRELNPRWTKENEHRALAYISEAGEIRFEEREWADAGVAIAIGRQRIRK